MKQTKKVLIIAILILFSIGFLWFLQELLTPKYVSNVVEGALIAEYYDEPYKDFDVVFIGDCEVYENFSPITLWNEYGINSYIRGSAEQYIMQSYYILEDTLRYGKPKVVVMNIQSLQFDKAQSEAYNRMTIEGMRWSSSKVNCIKASMTEDENFVDYVFPILRYHSRWNELTADDFKYIFEDKKISHNGYYMRVDVKPAVNVPKGRVLADYSFGENAWKYLDMMADLCEAEDIELLMIKAPSLFPYWYPEYDKQVQDYAAKRNLRYINFIDIADEVGIDYNYDTYDAGLHMNLSGAEKLSKYLGAILSDEFGVEDRRSEERLCKIWAEKTKLYNDERDRQLAGINNK